MQMLQSLFIERLRINKGTKPFLDIYISIIDLKWKAKWPICIIYIDNILIEKLPDQCQIDRIKYKCYSKISIQYCDLSNLKYD